MLEFVVYGRRYCKLFAFNIEESIIEEKVDIYKNICNNNLGKIVDDISECKSMINGSHMIIVATYTNKIMVLKDN